METVFEAALLPQKHPEANNVSPRADQIGLLPDAMSARKARRQSLYDFVDDLNACTAGVFISDAMDREV